MVSKRVKHRFFGALFVALSIYLIYGGDSLKRKIKEKLQFYAIVFLTITVVLCIMESKDNILTFVMKNERIYDAEIIIDAGHGGPDGGAVSSNGVAEADINLSISDKTRLTAAFLGIRSRMTRDDRNSLNYIPQDTIRQNKMNDLKARVKIGENNKNADFISIHLNKFSDTRYFGAQVFHKNDGSSILLAQNIQGALYKINDKNTRSFKQIPNENYIFDRIPNTGVIVECGFLSNAEEELLLQNDSYQSKLAMLIIGGYTNYKYNR